METLVFDGLPEIIVNTIKYLRKALYFLKRLQILENGHYTQSYKYRPKYVRSG
jgi:hypothetical protein